MQRSIVIISICLFIVLLSAAQPVSAEAGHAYLTQWTIDSVPFDVPNGVAADRNGNLFVVDTNNDRVQKCTANGTVLATVGSSGFGNGQFDGPEDVALDAAGSIYVTDTGNNRVQKFDSSGKFVKAWGTWGSGDGQFINPQCLAVDSVGAIYVTDKYNDRVQKFNASGGFIAVWGGYGTFAGQFSGPTGIAVDAWDNVYVIDSGNNRIQKFTSAGKFTRLWNGGGSAIAVDSTGTVYIGSGVSINKFSATGTLLESLRIDDSVVNRAINSITFNSADALIVTWQDADTYVHQVHQVGTYTTNGTRLSVWGCPNPRGIAVDRSGNVYVADTGNQKVEKFTPSGTMVASWGRYGQGDGQFRDPTDIAVDSSGTVYVADTSNRRVQKFTSNGTFVAKWNTTDTPTYGGQSPTPYYPTGIDVDGTGNVYTFYSWEGIRKYAPNGSLITSFKNTDGYGSTGVAVDRGTGDMYFVDTYKLIKVSSAGSYLWQWGTFGSFNAPRGLAVDSMGTVYVTDTDTRWGSASRIQKFSSTGMVLGEWGGYGTGNGEFVSPNDVAVDSAGYVYVADTGNNRVQKFAPDPLMTPAPTVLPVPTAGGNPLDLNDDGLFEDVNGNGRKDFADIVLYFNQMTWIAANEPVSTFDYNGNGRIDFSDIVWLFNHL